MTENKRFTYLNTTGWNKDGFLNVMNGLNEKNKKLQNENEQLYELINFANTLIAFKTSESCQNEWKKRLKELKE